MTYTAGIDVGSTYTKAVILDGGGRIAGRAMMPTGFRLSEAARAHVRRGTRRRLASVESQVTYLIATGYRPLSGTVRRRAQSRT